MTTKIQINPEQVDDLINEAAAFEKQQREAQPKPTTKTKIGGAGRITISGKTTTMRSDKPTSTTVSEGLPQGYVRLASGIEADLASIEAAGLEGEIVAVGRGTPGYENFKRERQTSSETDAPESEVDKTGQGDERKQLKGASEQDAEAILKAEEALNKGREAIGSSAVEAMQREAISSGEIPTELPGGITSEMVNFVVDGFTQQANVVLRDAGTNVDALVMLLNENELREARQAVFLGNDESLKKLGRLAKSRFAKLPSDPALFEQMTRDRPSHIQFTTRNGVMWVKTPTYELPWSEAVEQGKITL